MYNPAAVAKNDNFLTIHTLSLIRVLYWLCQIKSVIKIKVCEDDNKIASLLKLGIHSRVRSAFKLWLQINTSMAGRRVLLRLSTPLGACHSSRRSRPTACLE